MTNQNNDLPVNPPGISFEDWAALLTGGPTGTGGGAPMSPPPASAPVQPPAAAVPPAVVPPVVPVVPAPPAASVPPLQPSQVSPAASDPLAEALEASWRESLRQEALRDASQVQNPEPLAAPLPPAAFAAPVPAPVVLPPVEATASVPPLAPLAPPAALPMTSPVGESRRSRRAEIAAEVPDFSKTAPLDSGLFRSEAAEPDAVTAVLPVLPTYVIDIAPPVAPV
ncbi:MAG: hypothetical protein ABWX76_10375, partial [Leifsonia flava]